MKKRFYWMGALAVIAPVGSSFAQSSVTLSGLIDAGVSYVSNEGGSRNIKFDDGIFVPNLLTLSGKEDLGGGTRAVFNLTNQFELGSGSFVPGQSLFGRTAYVGLDDDRLGRLTLGNQYDFMPDALFGGLDDAAIYSAGLYQFRNGPFDKLALPNNPTGAFDWDRLAGERIANSVKYVSPVFHGFSGGLMYGFGNVAGSVGTGNASSFSINYSNGAFGANAAYTLEKSVTPTGQVSVRNWGAGSHYTVGPVTGTALFTTVRNNTNGAAVWQAEVGGLWMIDSFWWLSGAYSYMKGNASVDDNHAHQLSAMLEYLLSKRTGVYAAVVYQRASRGGNAQINGDLVPSSTPTQAIARIGLTTRF
ncbi:porin [Trinickia dinghuensis]|uniref:Porin n=1 Tax=Trinickia dinghuensis TaxID=2291023 RepID=A0A3D8K651_9BURK|nr:porin [Trinickia dinghuensis]RDV00345.1 porin [Trinickia dinghuensis]